MALQKYVAIFAGIATAVFLFALVMEVADSNDYNLLSTDPATGLYRYAPDSSFATAGDCYENTVDINNLGFHGPPVSLKKEKNVFRIVVIGSSYASAIQVSVKDMYSTVLQEKLNANPWRAYTYEVVPIAMGMNRVLLDMFYYLKYGSALAPDLVINIESDYNLIAQNAVDTPAFDAEGNVVLETPKSGENSTVASLRSFSRHSKFLVDLYNRALVFKSAWHSFLSAPFLSAAVSVSVTAVAKKEAEEARWQTQEKILHAYAAQVAKDGVPFVFASWTGPQAAIFSASEFPRHMPSIAERSHFQYVDLVPASRAAEAAAGRASNYPCDYHWNPDGNRYIAEALYEYLRAHPALLSR